MKNKIKTSISNISNFFALFLMIILLLISHFSLSQSVIKNYIQKNIFKVNSICPDSTNYDDLIEFGKAIGSASIVMLGEQDHGDAATFLAKTRLIKYLHEVKGFNVLAFESDFFGLNDGWDLLQQKNLKIDSFLKKNIYQLWTYCDACNNLLFNYIPKTQISKTPLIVTGFDNQMATKILYLKLDSVIKKTGIEFGKRENYATKISPMLDGWFINAKDTNYLNRVNIYLEEIKNQLTIKSSINNFWVVTVENLIQQNIEYKYYGRKGFDTKANNTRDIQMAKNLRWLVTQKYPKEKIIVWAHNYHISKYNGHFKEDFLNDKITMGGYFTSDSVIVKKTYVLGFTSLQGTSARIGQNEYKVAKPDKNSFEMWVNQSINFGFLDFTNYNNDNTNSEEFNMSCAVSGNNFGRKSYLTKWSKVFDGVFYIKNMYPCKEIK